MANDKNVQINLKELFKHLRYKNRRITYMSMGYGCAWVDFEPVKEKKQKQKKERVLEVL